MTTAIDIFRAIPISDWVWLELLLPEILDREARGEKIARRRGYSRNFDPDAYKTGRMAEWGYEVLTDQKPVPRGDNLGYDFSGRVDVKGSKYFDDPWLRRRPQSEDRAEGDVWRADYYALFGCELEKHVVQYQGYATREMLQSAPVVEKDYGPFHMLRAISLIQELPPPASWFAYA